MYCKEDVPCASLAVESVIRLGGAGFAWGLFYGSHEADRKGLLGTSRALFMMKVVGKCGLLCGLAAGTFAATHCKIQQLRMQQDWLNSSIAGAVTGAGLAMRTRSLKHIVTAATVVSAAATAAGYSEI